MKDLKFVNLIEEPEHLQQLASWHHAEWAGLNPGLSLQQRIEHMQSNLGQDFVPTTFLVKRGKALIGSAAIVAHDMDNHRDLSPWLASVYIVKNERNQGIGHQLIDFVSEQTKLAGLEKLFLFTPDRDRFYQHCGWKICHLEQYRGVSVTVMMKKL